MGPISSVLIVDDEPAVRAIMTRWASAVGLTARTAASAEEALIALEANECDLAVVDVVMPGHDGLWLVNELQRHHPQTAVVLATGHAEKLADNVQDIPIADLLIKPFELNRFMLAIDRGRQWRKEAVDQARWHKQLSAEMRDRTADLHVQIARRVGEGEPELDAVLALLAERLPDVSAHSDRVARYTLSVARELPGGAAAFPALEIAARLHDLGKLAVPEALITKPSTLTPGEELVMQRHVDAGVALLTSTRTLGVFAPFVHGSHERCDGTGYPRGLSGLEIPLASRILTVCDAYDAMTQRRSYSSAIDNQEAVAELVRCRGTQFDPEVLTVFLRVVGRH